MQIRPCELAQAKAYIACLHRHHKPPTGHRFSIAAWHEGVIVGVCVVGRPVAPKTDPSRVLEVTRLCTDGTKDACSALYGAAARAGKALGYERIQTFILASEPGTSLRAAGWMKDKDVRGTDGWQSRPGRDPNTPTEDKTRWVRVLNAH
jgi:hypothetical protein